MFGCFDVWMFDVWMFDVWMFDVWMFDVGCFSHLPINYFRIYELLFPKILNCCLMVVINSFLSMGFER